MNKDQELIEILLEGRSDGFKAKVLEVVYRHQLDPDDPNLQILIATGQLEVLLEEIPDRLQQIVEKAGKPWVINFQIDGSWQTAMFGLGVAISVGCLGWLGGWHMKSAQVYHHYSPEELAYLDRLWQMNSDRLLRCQQQQAKTCAIQLMPE